MPVVLPAADGGAPPITYQVEPSPPAGLTFDASTRTLQGTPTEVTASVPYVFRATDVNGSFAELRFSIEVVSPVGTQREALPKSFALRGNYPNPVNEHTQIGFNLPWPATVRVDVLDMLGRRRLSVPAQDLAGGWDRSINISGLQLPSGLYIYRVHAAAPGI